MDSDQFDDLVSRLSQQLTHRRRLGLVTVLGIGGAGFAADTKGKKKHKKNQKNKKKATTTKAPATQPPGSTTPTLPQTSNIVISQVYTRGGNSGAVYNRDYIELFNRSSQAVDVGTWSVQVSGSASTTWNAVPLTGFTMLPGEYLLIAGADNGSSGDPLPGFDIDSNASVLHGGGRIAVVTSTTPLACGASASCVTAPGVVDFLGYGATGAHSEGGLPASLPTSTQALFRKGNGCTDTNNNGPDFTLSSPGPRKSGFQVVCP